LKNSFLKSWLRKECPTPRIFENPRHLTFFLRQTQKRDGRPGESKKQGTSSVGQDHDPLIGIGDPEAIPIQGSGIGDLIFQFSGS
jgi:hypothetical protein